MVFDSYRTSPLTFGVHCPPCQSSRIQLREKTHLNFCSFTKFYCIDNQGNWNNSSFSLFPSYCTYPSRPLWPNYSSLITDRHLHLHFHTDDCPPSCSPTESANITQIFLLKCTFPNKNNFVPKWWILWSKVIPKCLICFLNVLIDWGEQGSAYSKKPDQPVTICLSQPFVWHGATCLFCFLIYP